MVIHQTQPMAPREEMTSEQTPEVACGTRNQNRRAVRHALLNLDLDAADHPGEDVVEPGGDE